MWICRRRSFPVRSLHPPTLNGSPPKPIPPGGNQHQTSSKKKTTAHGEVAAAKFWKGAMPVDPARADEVISVGALGAIMQGIHFFFPPKAHAADFDLATAVVHDHGSLAAGHMNPLRPCR